MNFYEIEKRAKETVENFEGACQDYANFVDECEKQVVLNKKLIEGLHRKLIEKHKKYNVGQIVTIREFDAGIILEHSVIASKIHCKIAIYNSFDKKFDTDNFGWYHQDAEFIEKCDGVL